MSDQPKALRLADALDNLYVYGLKGDAATELRRLHDEVESLRQAYNIVTDDCRNLTEKVIPNIRAERDALLVDAERYRWLRDMDEDPVMSLAAQYTDCNGSAISISMRIDAAIDAARSKT